MARIPRPPNEAPREPPPGTKPAPVPPMPPPREPPPGPPPPGAYRSLATPSDVPVRLAALKFSKVYRRRHPPARRLAPLPVIGQALKRVSWRVIGGRREWWHR
jgi:hypothetical protein